MSSFEELPEVLTRIDFGSLVGREPRSVESMAARGLVAGPTHRNRGKWVWEEDVVVDWFRTLHEHAVIVPANALAQRELATYQAYLCPSSSSHVSLARPRRLVMYRPGGEGSVFDVTAVETVRQKIPGTRPTSAETRRIVRDEKALEDWRTPWTVFYLRGFGRIETVKPPVQQGRYLRMDDVRQGLDTGRVVVPTLDQAFPTRT